MHCNIDKRGQVVRLVMGLVFIAIAIVIAIATYVVGQTAWLYLLAAVLLFSGAFLVYEAQKKWCGLRAMGFRTPV